MIQRIQSIYLLLAASAILSCFFFPILTYQVNPALEGETNVPIQQFEISTYAKYEIVDGVKNELQLNILESIFVGVIGLIAIVSIFIYQDRTVQLQLTRLYLFVTVILIVVLVINVSKEINIYGVLNKNFKLGAYLPSAGIIFSFLASKGIQRDIDKVSAADRIR